MVRLTQIVIGQNNATISGGKATLTVTGGGFSQITQSITYTSGKQYKLTAKIQGLSGSSGKDIRFQDNGSNNGGLTTANGIITLDESLQNIDIIWTANSNSSEIVIARSTSSGDYAWTVDNVSIKEIQEADFDFSRGSSATRVNEQGLVEDVQILSGELVQNGNFEQIGVEEVTNGNFETDSDWTKGTGWSIADGRASRTAQASSSELTATNTTLTTGNIYKCVMTVSNVLDGAVRFQTGSTGSTLYTSDGTYTEYIKAQGASFSIKGNANFTGSIDNVSVKEVGQNWSFGTGWSIEDGKAVSDGSQTGNSLLQQASILTLNKLYKVSYDLTVDSGTISARLGFGGQGAPRTTSGSYTEFLTCSGNTNFDFLATSTYSGSVDNVSIIEITNDTDLPRIDYSPYSGAGTCGHLLLEPQRTNRITYSNGFDDSSWQKQGVNVTANAGISPDGTNNAYLIEAQSNTSQHRTRKTGAPSNTASVSIFAKKGTTDYAYFFCGGGSKAIQAIFDLSDGSVTDSKATGSGAGFTSASSVSLGNDWYRLQLSGTFSTPPANTIGIVPYYQSTIVGSPDTGWLGSGESIYIYGAMEENGSYVSSYVPTESSTVTRSIETANNSGNADLFNDSEGVLYAEVERFENDTGFESIGISDGTTNNQVVFKFRNTTNLVWGLIKSGGANQAIMQYTASDLTVFNKLAIKYKANDFALWFNGVQVLTDTSGIVATGLNTLRFQDGGAFEQFNGKTKALAVFKEALSNNELELLTGEGYNSFAALAAAYNYNVI